MKKENFKHLLTDLYNTYNPSNLKFVEDLVEKYSRLEFDAVKNIFIKYNYKNSEHYDPSIGTNEYILELINIYDSGVRALQTTDIKQEAIARNNEKKNNSLNIDVEKVNNIEKGLRDKIENLESLLNKKDENVEPTIRVVTLNSDIEVNLPNKKYLSNLGTGSRIITRDAENKVIGLEIEDITIDFVSDDKNPVIEITVKKI